MRYWRSIHSGQRLPPPWRQITSIAVAGLVLPASASARPVVEVLCESTLFESEDPNLTMLTDAQQKRIEEHVVETVREACAARFKYLEWQTGGREPGTDADTVAWLKVTLKEYEVLGGTEACSIFSAGVNQEGEWLDVEFSSFKTKLVLYSAGDVREEQNDLQIAEDASDLLTDFFQNSATRDQLEKEMLSKIPLGSAFIALPQLERVVVLIPPDDLKADDETLLRVEFAARPVSLQEGDGTLELKKDLEWDDGSRQGIRGAVNAFNFAPHTAPVWPVITDVAEHLVPDSVMVFMKQYIPDTLGPRRGRNAEDPD